MSFGVELALIQKFVELARGYRQISHWPEARSRSPADSAKAVTHKQNRVAFRAMLVATHLRVGLIADDAGLRIGRAKERAKDHREQNPDSVADDRDQTKREQQGNQDSDLHWFPREIWRNLPRLRGFGNAQQAARLPDINACNQIPSVVSFQ
jgi:hypothetical protein